MSSVQVQKKENSVILAPLNTFRRLALSLTASLPSSLSKRRLKVSAVPKFRVSQILLGLFVVVIFLAPTVTQAATVNDVVKPTKKSSYADFAEILYSPSATVQDVDSGKFLYRRNPNVQRPIASISKVMTALVFLESKPKMTDRVFYKQTSDRIGATVPVRSGELLTKKQVLMGTLLPSANNMAVTLSKSTKMSEKKFIAEMNERAQEIGLTKTQFVEPTGLSTRNLSTADNVSKMARYAFAKYPKRFQEAAHTQVYSYTIVNSKRRMNLYSTNKFDGHGTLDLVAFKTGYLPGTANRTLVAQIKEKSTGNEVIVTLLGNPQYGTIFDEAEGLANWSFANYNFPK